MAMAKVVGVSFSDKFGVDENWLKKRSIFDPTLDIDSPLFVDPFLLMDSKHIEFSKCASERYEERFVEIYKLLRLSNQEDDKAWKGAYKKFKFGELSGLSGTCLGYSKHSTKGRGFGPILSKKALIWAKGVIDLGVQDIELFSSMSLFEGGIGADLISDMVINITIDCIINFNNRVYNEIKKDLNIDVFREEHDLIGRTAMLPRNPFSNEGAPVILLAADILKHLPIMEDPRNLADIAKENAELRDRVNQNISEIWKIRTKKEKEEIKRRAMESSASFQTLLDLLKILEKTPYDIHKDPDGLIEWRSLAQNFTALYKLDISDDKNLKGVNRIDFICKKIIEQFRSLVEDNHLSKSFYVDYKPRHERFAQLLFYAIAVAYCDANDLDVSPEADAGVGPVDFKFSQGRSKVVVEIKLSTNSQLVNGFRKQLTAYMKAEKTDYGHYVVIDVGKLGGKWEKLNDLYDSNKDFAKTKKIHLVDGTIKLSASKMK